VLSLFTILVHRIAYEVEAFNRILEVIIVLVVTVREDKQLKVLQESALGLVVRKLFEYRQLRFGELSEGWHDREPSLSLDKALVLERFELGLVEEGHAAVTRSLVEEIEVGVVLRVVFFLLRDGRLALSGSLLGLNRLYWLLFRASLV